MIKKKLPKDVLGIIFEFQRAVIENKPTLKEMYEEIRMMRFKIRPLQGDVSLINLADVHLIEALWNLGKLDEFYKREFRNVSRKDRLVFFQFFEHLHKQFQKDLDNIALNIPIDFPENDSSIIEMEIFKERSDKKKQN